MDIQAMKSTYDVIIEQGAFYCRGGFNNLADALTEGITKHGGELILGTRVRKIQGVNGYVKGIVLESGQQINALVVISNIDARTTFQDLLERDQVPSGYLRKLKRMETSGSCLGLYLATDLDIHDLGIPKVTMASSWDIESAYAASMQGRVEGMAVHIPTAVDSSLAPSGEHIVVLQALVPTGSADLSPTAKTCFAESLLDKAEKVLPELQKHITFIAGAAQESQQEYPLHRISPIYGWANSTNQAGPRRLPYKTPVSGLYLAGYWMDCDAI